MGITKTQSSSKREATGYAQQNDPPPPMRIVRFTQMRSFSAVRALQFDSLLLIPKHFKSTRLCSLLDAYFKPARAEKAAAAAAATAAAEVGEARVLAAKHLLDQAVAAKVERAALRQEFSTKIRSYDEQTSLQVCNLNFFAPCRVYICVMCT